MDGDDVALPERFARQVAFLRAHPEVGLLGTACREISASGEVLRTITPPGDDRALRRVLIRTNPFTHSSMMFRRTVLDASGWYDERFVVAQDYELWLRMSRLTRLANLDEPLVLRRLAPGQLSSARDTTRIHDEVTAKLKALRSGTYTPLVRGLSGQTTLCPGAAARAPPGTPAGDPPRKPARRDHAAVPPVSRRVITSVGTGVGYEPCAF
jgi:hypothetical protein